MNILIVAINSQYVHFSLAPWYLKANIQSDDINVDVIEKNINQNIDDILYEILQKDFDVLCMSVYIWNIEYAKKIICEIRKLKKNVKIILGGPEVSYDSLSNDIINNSDYIINGEGEEALKEYIYKGKKTNGFNIVENLDGIKSPYTKEMLNKITNKIIYYESSRGCPFRCSYCLSSTIKKLRYFSLGRVFYDLNKIIKSDAKIVKFVDRTFNANLNRAKEILKYLIKHGEDKTYHFEIVADNLDDEIIEIFNNAKDGLFQLEIGIQSLNQDTLNEIDRKFNIKEAKRNIVRLLKNNNMMIHLDLIAFLPYEDLNSFIDSFNWIYSLKPHEIQIGFLKMLKGTKIYKEKDKYKYITRNYSPYEVLENNFISYKEGIFLKKFEKIFNRLYNRNHFNKTLCKIEKKYNENYFEMFSDMIDFFEKKDFFIRNFSYKNLATVINEYAKSINISVKEEIVFDYLSVNPTNALGKDFYPKEDIRKKVEGFVNRGKLDKYYKGIRPQTIMKKITYYPFLDGDYIFLSDYKNKVTGRNINIKIVD